MIAQVDLSVWEMATVCGNCHVGGSLVEQDRAGVRLSQRSAPTDFNAIDHYVSDDFDSATGLPNFSVQQAPWKYLQPYDIDQNGTIDAGEGFMMPNVREMDCFMCHLQGFNNVINSVAVQMGYLNAAPSMSAGLLSMFSGAYIPGTVSIDETTGAATLSGTTLSKLKAEPPTENCQQCHTPDNMANFTEMFEKFLSAAPMEYNPAAAYASPFTGKAMPSYDLNAAFVPQGSTSPEVFFDFSLQEWGYTGGGSAAGPFGLFPMALDSSWSMFDGSGNPNTAPAGGVKPGMTGPLYYAGSGDPSQSIMPDQNAMKKSTIPFPKADWFKRGDLWESELEVHYNLGCAGCHYNGNASTGDLNQCDPGRGHVRLGGIENGGMGQLDTRDTVKTCRGCHLDGVNWEGTAIQTFNAPNPDNAHRLAGLLDNVTQAVGPNGPIAGNHLDVIDCAVCHIYKKSMAVRALDCTSGKRFPTLIGIDDSKGMMGMFTDPMTVANMSDAEAIGAFTNNMLAMGYTQGTIDYMLGSPADANVARSMLTNDLQEWQPIYGWHANAPAGHSDWRRKIIPINFITAQLWDDSKDSRDGAATIVDANGDGGEGYQNVLWDPWISRDMKAGMNFSNTGFATVPTGFGGGSYQSAYNADGTFTGAFNYVGIYGGNIILTTPEEIGAYKDHRNTLATNYPTTPGVNKPWDSTQLVFQGGNPFQVTHNISPVSKHVLGKSCSDCHAPDSGFFSGGYDMTGSAVPASATYDPDGAGSMANAVASNMMQRPVVDYEVVALEADLRTGSEAKRKDTGVVEDVEFDELGCWDGTTFTPYDGVNCITQNYRRTHDLDRSEFMYPNGSFPTADYEGNPIGSIEEWVHYLESIGAAPTASIIAPTGGATLTVGQTVTLTADSAQSGPFTYTWTCTDTAGELTGASVDRAFNIPGTFTLRLAVTNNNTGAVATASQTVTVASAPVGSTGLTAAFSYPAGSKPQLAITAVPATTNRLVVIWGDGKRQMVENPVVPLTLEHAFQTYMEAAPVTEVRAVAYPNGGLLAKLTVTPDMSQIEGGKVKVNDAVTIDLSFVGLVTNVDLVTLTGTRSAGKTAVVNCSDTNGSNLDNPSVGSVWYPGTDSWSVDVQLSEDAPNTCTATVGTANDSVDLTYTPATGGPTAAPTNLNYTVDGYDAVNGTMNVTLTGAFTGNGNTIDVVVNYPVDAAVETVTYPTATTFSVPITGLLYNDPNYITVQEVDAAGNDGPDNYYTIQYEATP